MDSVAPAVDTRPWQHESPALFSNGARMGIVVQLAYEWYQVGHRACQGTL